MKKTSDVSQYNGVDAMEMAKQAAKSTVSTVQNTVQSGLAKAQDVLLTGLGVAQDVLEQNTRRASKGLKKAQRNVRDTRNSLQSQLERRARRRKRTRTMFRMGLLTGFVVMLFYAPWPGSETRRQLVAFWQGLFPRQQLSTERN